MAYTLQMLRFLDGQPIIIESVSFQTFALPDDATAEGHHLVTKSAGASGSRVGFRVLDHSGQQIHTWQIGDSEVWEP